MHLCTNKNSLLLDIDNILFVLGVSCIRSVPYALAKLIIKDL